MSKKVEFTDGGLQYFINKGLSQKRIDEIRNNPDDQFTVRWANETANGRNLYNVTQAITDPKTGKTFLVEYASYSGESFKEAIAREVREGYTDFFICEIDSDQGYHEVSYHAPEGDVIRAAVETNDGDDCTMQAGTPGEKITELERTLNRQMEFFGWDDIFESKSVEELHDLIEYDGTLLPPEMRLSPEMYRALVEHTEKNVTKIQRIMCDILSRENIGSPETPEERATRLGNVEQWRKMSPSEFQGVAYRHKLIPYLPRIKIEGDSGLYCPGEEQIAALMYEWDLVGVAGHAPRDEYSYEARKVYLALIETGSLARMDDYFNDWFNSSDRFIIIPANKKRYPQFRAEIVKAMSPLDTEEDIELSEQTVTE